MNQFILLMYYVDDQYISSQYVLQCRLNFDLVDILHIAFSSHPSPYFHYCFWRIPWAAFKSTYLWMLWIKIDFLSLSGPDYKDFQKTLFKLLHFISFCLMFSCRYQKNLVHKLRHDNIFDLSIFLPFLAIGSFLSGLLDMKVLGLAYASRVRTNKSTLYV